MGMNFEEKKISFIIPAFNEEVLLPATLSALHQAIAAIDMASEIIVVDNHSTDSTATVASEMGATVVYEEINQISRARNAGARVAGGDILFFIDADTIVSDLIIQHTLNLMKNENVAGGGICVSLDSQAPKSARYWTNLWNWVSRRSKLAAGCFIFCSKDAFEASGGFSEKVYVAEEILFSFQLHSYAKKHRENIVIINEHSVITSSRKLQWYSPITIILWMGFYILFPFAGYYRILCPMWYKRP